MERFDEQYYSETSDFVMTSLPFNGEKIVMDLILPRNGAKLSYEEYGTLCENAALDSVFLTMPKFEIDPNYDDIAAHLSKIGVPLTSHWFTRLGIANSNPCSINEIIHKMHVSVSETGAEAAAATLILWCGSSSPNSEPEEPTYKIVYLSDPFYFVIREVEHNIILAIGHIADTSIL